MCFACRTTAHRLRYSVALAYRFRIPHNRRSHGSPSSTGRLHYLTDRINMCFLDIDDRPGPGVRVVEYRPGTLRVSMPGPRRRRSSCSSGSSSDSGSSSSSPSSSSSSCHSSSNSSSSDDTTVVIAPSPLHHHHHRYQRYSWYARSKSPEPESSYTTVQRTRVRTRSESIIPFRRRFFDSPPRSPSPVYRCVRYVEPGGWGRSRLHHPGRVWEEEVRFVSGRGG